jgi:hypothetical protein
VAEALLRGEIHWPYYYTIIFHKKFTFDKWIDDLGVHPMTVDTAWHCLPRGRLPIQDFLIAFHFLRHHPTGRQAAGRFGEPRIMDPDTYERHIREAVNALAEFSPQVRRRRQSHVIDSVPARLGGSVA